MQPHSHLNSHLGSHITHTSQQSVSTRFTSRLCTHALKVKGVKNTLMKLFTLTLVTGLAGCAVVGEANVENAPYQVLKAEVLTKSESPVELRRYDAMVLVSASMEDEGRNTAFRRLFNYIAGANEQQAGIAMTAPVFMTDETNEPDAEPEQGVKIAMTAPVFMTEQNSGDADLVSGMNGASMSFVMPADFTLASTPKPLDSKLVVSEVKDYRLAAITFNWTLSKSNVAKHTKLLRDWIAKNNLEEIGAPFTAAYNGPMTLPMYRKNEVLIPVK